MQVFLIVALSADGFIAPSTDQKSAVAQASTVWTSQADKKFFQTRTKKAGVVVMGRKTYQTIGRPLPGRLNIVYSQAQNGLFEQQSQSADLKLTQAEPTALIKQLKEQGHQEVAICGGASIYTQFMQARVVDRLYLTVHPIIFGQGMQLFNEVLNFNLKLVESQLLDKEGTLLLEYLVKYK